MVRSSPSRAMPLVTATLIHADRLIWWSATSIAAAAATPAVVVGRCSSVPASCCHWASVTGSLATGVARGDGLLDAGEVLLHGRGPGQLGVVGGQVGRAQQGFRVLQRLACLAAAMPAERDAVGRCHPRPGQHAGQQRVLLRELSSWPGRWRSGRGPGQLAAVGLAVGLGQEQPGLGGDALAVAASASSGVSARALTAAAQRGELAQAADHAADRCRLARRLAADR